MLTLRFTADPQTLCRRGTLAMLLCLLIQFALGMTTSLYTQIPPHHRGSNPTDFVSGSLESLGWALDHGGLALGAHLVLGVVLVAASLLMILGARRLDRRLPLLATLLGAGCVVGAGFNGASFLDFAESINSLIMSLLFALASAAYVLTLYTLAPNPDATQQEGKA